MKLLPNTFRPAFLVGSLLVPAAVMATIDVAIKGGVILPLSGTFHESISDGFFSIDSKSFDDIYDPIGTIGIEVIGHTGSRSQIFAGFAYENGEADRLAVGSVPGLGGSEVLAKFDDYTAYSFYLGARYIFDAPGNLYPFVSVLGGYKRVNEISVDLTIPDANINTGKVAFYDESDVLFGGFDVGLRYQFSPSFSVVGEVGLRYQTKLDDDDAAISALGLENLNDGEGFLTVPLTISANLTF
ncbi:MAG: hypothetical protein ACFCU4_10680 [Puniceicoccaceae bacterium]